MALGTAMALTGALAVPATAAAHPSDNRPRVDVIARGLNNPRGVTIADDRILVAEAGTGGNSEFCIANPEQPGEKSCLGNTGSVTAVEKGKQRRIITGLPSLAGADGSAAVGLTGVAAGPDGLIGVIGLGGHPDARAGLGPSGKLFASLVALSPNRAPKQLADLGAYEKANNPDSADPGSSVDTNPYSLVSTSRGTVVTDAGGNDVLNVDRWGNVSTLAVLHAQFVPSPFGGQMPMQAVPTSVARGADGSYYVGQLTGFPFPVGGAKVYRVRPGHDPEVVADGFTNIVGVAADKKGRLYVLEIMKNGLFPGTDPTGALYRIDRNGQRTELAAGQLIAPGGVAVDDDGTVYVSNKSIFAGGGELLRIRG
nr:ScyD/ScyE family protein [Planosporangium thailandense]